MSAGPCDNCGLCCQHLLVEADAVDALREPRIEEVRPLGKRNIQLSVLDACWVLAGPGMPCPFLTTDKRCGIYPTRPQTCVAFMPGSSQCQQLRKEHGMAPVPPQPSVHTILSEIIQAAIAAQTTEPELE